MKVDPNFVYSVKEVSEIIGLGERQTTRIAKDNGIKKDAGRYLFEGKFLIKHFNLSPEEDIGHSGEDIGHSNGHSSEDNEQLDLEIESLKERIKDLESDLEHFEIEDNERIEIFTKTDYKVFETRLMEWQTLQTRLEHQTELFEAEKLSSGELITHYKQQLKYQKEQSTRILDIHERLVQTVNSQNKQALQRNTIEAIDKGVVNKDTWRRER
jgi:hypothetical protein